MIKTDGKWQITGPKPYPADQEAVAVVLSTLSGLNADRIVEENASDRKQYGLEPAQVELDISGKNGATQRLLLGDDTVAGGDVYAALVTDPRVFTIASYNKSSLAKSLNDLRDKSLLTLSADKVSRVELIRKGEDLEFDRTKDGWQILKPSSSPADSCRCERADQHRDKCQNGPEHDRRCGSRICPGNPGGNSQADWRQWRADTRRAQEQRRLLC